ncbi:hypothetical protein QLH62_11400 [Streptococcus iniae]|nr:hypothetical protein QLH62_11400 [Streptococcus iniae]
MTNIQKLYSCVYTKLLTVSKIVLDNHIISKIKNIILTGYVCLAMVKVIQEDILRKKVKHEEDRKTISFDFYWYTWWYWWQFVSG